MFIIYDLVFLLIIIIHLPVYLFGRKFHRGFWLRLGFLPKSLPLDRPIWIHAVSVGEAVASRQFIEELRLAFPHKKIVISTVTPTGNKIAKTIAKEGDFVTYLPLDISFIVDHFVTKINPSLFICVEAEIWPNLIYCLHKKHLPIAVINGRVSDRSFMGYSVIKFLIKPVFDKVGLFCVQSSRDAQRLLSLGVAKSRIEVTGNMKFDASAVPSPIFHKKINNIAQHHPEQASGFQPGARRRVDFQAEVIKFDNSILRFKEEESLLVCGSTHPGEEDIILYAYKGLLTEFPDLRLLIAPRHPERADEVGRLITNSGFNPVMVSQLASLSIIQSNRQTGKPANRQTIFILDTVGQLMTFYSIADIVFVGGSLSKTGGHNILEPAALGKPVIFGPHMFNFRDIADLFLNNQAALLIHSREELQNSVRGLLRNPASVLELSRAAKKLISDNQGATRRSLERVRQFDVNFSTL